jgi:hypothetical protein
MPDGSEIAPYSSFLKTWRVRNDGKGDWPEGCHLVSAGGDRLVDPKLGEDFVIRQPVPVVVSGEEVDVTVELCAPTSTGRHVGYFRLQNPEGGYFGQRLWSDIRVNEEDMSVSMTLAPWEMIDNSDESTKEEENKPSSQEEEQLDSRSSDIIVNTQLMNLDNETANQQEKERANQVDEVVAPKPLTPEEIKQLEFDQDVSNWANELNVLSAMGFSDLDKLLPLLKTHVKVPALLRDKNGNEDPGSEAGLQAVVLALLSEA